MNTHEHHCRVVLHVSSLNGFRYGRDGGDIVLPRGHAAGRAESWPGSAVFQERSRSQMEACRLKYRGFRSVMSEGLTRSVKEALP